MKFFLGYTEMDIPHMVSFSYQQDLEDFLSKVDWSTPGNKINIIIWGTEMAAVPVEKTIVYKITHKGVKPNEHL